MYCKAENYGQVVACHSNSLEHGKGMGIKADDLCAYLCDQCHDKVDGRRKSDDGLLIFYTGVFNTVRWLIHNGHMGMKNGHDDRP